MRFGNRVCTMTTALMAIGLATSCGKKKSSSDTNDGITATSVADLNLSSSLNLSLPAGLASAAGQSSTLALDDFNLTGKRSSEACRTVQQVKQLMDNLSSISGTMCHLEAESAQFAFGQKYDITLTEGGQTGKMQLWADNSVAGQLTVYICQAGSLQEKIVVNSSNSVGASGSVHHMGTEGSATWANKIKFDFTTSGVKILSGQNTYAMGSDKFATDSSLTFRDVGVSTMTMSNKGSSSDFGTFADRGAVHHNGTTGQALFKGTGSHASQTYDFSSRSTFDKDGYAVDNSTASSDITVASTELPSFLDDSFSIDAPSGWDCSGGTAITVNADTAAHQACQHDHNMNFDCFGTDFAQGTNETVP